MVKGDSGRNIVAALSYIPFFSIILSAVILFVEKEDKYIRFHAFQALLISILYYFLSIFLGAVAKGFLSFLSGVFSPIWALLFLAIWIVSMIKAFQGELFKWPIIGRYAEKYVR